MKTSPLEQYLLDARFSKIWGRNLRLKISTLAAVLDGGNLIELAKASGVTPEAIRRIARKVRAALAQEILVTIDLPAGM